MNTSKIGCFTAFLRRSCFAIAFIFAGVIASQSASAALEGAAAYNGKFVVPSFVPDVRALIVGATTRHSWKIIDEKPGVLTLRLDHAKSHMTVVAKAVYTKSDFWFEKVSANTYQCDPQQPCMVDPEIVQRWMVTLHREAGVQLLRLAIQDAGGSVPSK